MPAPSATGAATPGATTLSGDVQQLQVWAQHLNVTIEEINRALNRLSNLVQQIIKLNNLKSKP